MSDVLRRSDVERRLASPLDTIARVKFSQDAASMLKRTKDFDVCALIVGLPLNMDGAEGQRAQATRALMRNLSKLASPPYAFWAERLSTAARSSKPCVHPPATNWTAPSARPSHWTYRRCCWRPWPSPCSAGGKKRAERNPIPSRC